MKSLLERLNETGAVGNVKSEQSQTELNKILDFVKPINSNHKFKILLSDAVKKGEFEKAWSLVLFHSDWFDDNGLKVASLANAYVPAGKDYFPNGALKAIVPYVKGLEHGIAKTWHKNGRLESEVTMVNGMKDGTYTVWEDDGEIAHKEVFKKDRLVM